MGDCLPDSGAHGVRGKGPAGGRNPQRAHRAAMRRLSERRVGARWGEEHVQVQGGQGGGVALRGAAI